MLHTQHCRYGAYELCPVGGLCPSAATLIRFYAVVRQCGLVTCAGATEAHAAGGVCVGSVRAEQPSLRGCAASVEQQHRLRSRRQRRRRNAVARRCCEREGGCPLEGVGGWGRMTFDVV